MELTDEQIERQDFVDNRIFELIQELNPFEMKLTGILKRLPTSEKR